MKLLKALLLVALLTSMASIVASAGVLQQRDYTYGTNVAQPGPDPQCRNLPSWCWITSIYDYGDVKGEKLVYEPGTNTAYDHVDGVSVYGFNMTTGDFYYHINTNNLTYTFSCNSIQDVDAYIAAK